MGNPIHEHCTKDDLAFEEVVSEMYTDLDVRFKYPFHSYFVNDSCTLSTFQVESL